jgi:hypothetical protein
LLLSFLSIAASEANARTNIGSNSALAVVLFKCVIIKSESRKHGERNNKNIMLLARLLALHTIHRRR